MGTVVDLAGWRRKRSGAEDAFGEPPDEEASGRLERAIIRLSGFVSAALDSQGRLRPRVETELLAIIGELSVGLTSEAASRAERLAAQLARPTG